MLFYHWLYFSFLSCCVSTAFAQMCTWDTRRSGGGGCANHPGIGFISAFILIFVRSCFTGKAKQENVHDLPFPFTLRSSASKYSIHSIPFNIDQSLLEF